MAASPDGVGDGWTVVSRRGVHLLRCGALSALPGLAHAFSTRRGGGSDLDLGSPDDRRPDAEALFMEVIRIYESLGKREHAAFASGLNNLASLYQSIGDYAKAESLTLQALRIYEKTLGKAHPAYGNALANLSWLYKSMGNYAKSEPILVEALEIRKRVLGDDHRDYATSLNNLGLLYRSMGDYEKAEPLLREVTEIRKLGSGTQTCTARTVLLLAKNFLIGQQHETPGRGAKSARDCPDKNLNYSRGRPLQKISTFHLQVTIELQAIIFKQAGHSFTLTCGLTCNQNTVALLKPTPDTGCQLC